MPKQPDTEYSLSSHSDGMRYQWQPYTRAEVEALARKLGEPEDRSARNVDPRIPRLLATLLHGYAE